MTRKSSGQLTTGQRQCLRLVLLHMTSKEIARELGISPHTVDQRLRRAIQLLGVHTRFEAARKFARISAPGPYQSLVYQTPAIEKNPAAANLSSPTSRDGEPADHNETRSMSGFTDMFGVPVAWGMKVDRGMGKGWGISVTGQRHAGTSHDRAGLHGGRLSITQGADAAGSKIKGEATEKRDRTRGGQRGSGRDITCRTSQRQAATDGKGKLSFRWPEIRSLVQQHRQQLRSGSNERNLLWRERPMVRLAGALFLALIFGSGNAMVLWCCPQNCPQGHYAIDGNLADGQLKGS